MLQAIDYSALSATLTASLNLKQPPVAISFSDTIPGSMGPHVGQAPAGCSFWEQALTASFATTAADHSLCAIGVYTHNLEPSPAQQTDLVDALKVFADLQYVTAQDVAAIPILASRPRYVLYAPLAEAEFAPDVVLLFVDARQTLVLSEAVEQVEGAHTPAMGRPACAVIPQVMNSGRAALSLGCCGARAYLDVLTDDVAVFAIPGSKLEAFAGRIESLAQANRVLAEFHHRRRRAIEGGSLPTVRESLAAMSAG